jgi:hypothetical protein
VISSSRTLSGQVGVPFTKYSTLAAPAATSFVATGLPDGLVLNAANGEITGTPTVSGTFRVTLAGSNASGAGTPVIVTIVIAPSATLVVPGT